MTVRSLEGARWFTSSRSGTTGQCVEVAFVVPGQVAVRDSKDPAGAVLLFTDTEWAAFVSAARADRLDG